MKLSDFDYEYPRELIAQRPLARRDASRMMIVKRSSKTWEHSEVSKLSLILKKGDVLVVNDSKVIPARIFGTRPNGETIELLIVEPKDGEEGTWRCLLRKAKRIRKGERLHFGMQATATALGRDDIFLLVNFEGKSLELAMKHHGVPPLPPYITRDGKSAYSYEDRERYQTIFAKNSGSSAAPTAGLHFSAMLMQRFFNIGVEVAYITLHVGVDTFQPVRNELVRNHKMHGEKYAISEDAANVISRAKADGRRIIAVGTTTTRALESAALNIEDDRQIIASGEFRTRLFITPGFEFKVVDAMLTNFHQPKSTLLMLVAAFAGYDLIRSCYDEAIKEKYRLFSYGDCMLIL